MNADGCNDEVSRDARGGRAGHRAGRRKRHGYSNFPELMYTSSERVGTIVENNSYWFRVCNMLRGTLSVPEVCEYLKVHVCRVQTLASKSTSFQILGT